MSLRSAVSIVLEEMEKEAKGWKDGFYQYRLRYLATHLRVALEASDSDQTTVGEKWHSPDHVPRTLYSHFSDVAISEDVQKEDAGPRMVECADGPGENCFVEVPSIMPENAFCHVAGAVYQLRGGKLYVHLSEG